MKSMKPLTIALVLFAAAVAVFGFDPTRGARIAVLDSSPRYSGRDVYVSSVVEQRICEELRNRGFDAFETRTTLDRLMPFDSANDDYYLELIGSGGSSVPIADASVGAGNVAVDFGLVVSHVAAQLRLYDGRTLELLQTINLEKRKTTLVPMAVGAWSGRIAFSIAAPARWLQERTVMRGIANDAAAAIAVQLYQQSE